MKKKFIKLVQVDWEKQYLELFPSIMIGWKPWRIYVGWLIWFGYIEIG
jgi:hypothetical protein